MRPSTVPTRKTDMDELFAKLIELLREAQTGDGYTRLWWFRHEIAVNLIYAAQALTEENVHVPFAQSRINTALRDLNTYLQETHNE